MKKQLNPSEKQQLKQRIVLDNQMLMRSRSLNRKLVGLSAVMIFLSWLLFAQKIDLGILHQPLKWLMAIVAIVLLFMSILSLISFFNAKRRLKYLMDVYDGKQTLK